MQTPILGLRDERGTTGPKSDPRSCASWIETFQLHARRFAKQGPLRYATLGDLQHSLTYMGLLVAYWCNLPPLGGISPRRQLSYKARVNVLYATHANTPALK